MKAIDEVITLQEAAQIWGRTSHTIQQLIQKGRFTRDECRKSGRLWLVTREGMIRLYGEPKNEK